MMFALSMAVGFCACGEKEAETPPAEETPEVTLRLHYELSTAEVAEGKEAVLFQQGEGTAFLALINRKTGENIPEGAEEEPDFVNDGRYDVYESALFHVSRSGKRDKIRRYRTMPAPEGPQDDPSYYSESRPRAFRMTEDGRVLALESSYECWQDESRIPSFQTRDRSYIRVLSENGTEISCSEILPGSDTGALDCDHLAYLGDDLLAVPEGQRILLFNTDGQEVFSVSAPLPIRELIPYRNKLAVILENGSQRWLSIVDPADRSVAVPQELPEDAHEFCEGADGSLVFIRNSEVFALPADGTESVRKFSLLEAGIDPGTVGAMYADDDGSLHFLLHEWQRDRQVTKEIHAVLSPVQVPDSGLTLRLGFSDISGALREALVSWIRGGENSAQVEVYDFNNGSATFDSVDLMVLGEEAWRIRDEAGLLADLDPLLSEETNTVFPSILSSLRGSSGRLTRVAGSFWIESMACDSDTVNGRTTLSFSDLRTLLAEMPAGSRLYEPYYCSDRLLEALLAVNHSAIGEGAEEPQLSVLQDFAALQPQTYDYRSYAADTSSMEKRIYDGRLLLLQAHIGSLEELKAYDDFFNSGACFVGWPTENSSYSRFCFDECLSVSADCSAEQKAAARQILSLLLTADYSESSYGFPVQRDRLEELMEEDAANIVYRVDEDGHFVLNKKKEKTEAARSVWYSAEWRKHSVYALTDVQRGKLLKLIDACV